MPGLVDFGELWLEVRGHAVAELLDSVYPGGLEQLGELPCHTPYAEKVGVVGPFENQGGRDARGLGECLAPLGVAAVSSRSSVVAIPAASSLAA